jgi:hypothetical protein
MLLLRSLSAILVMLSATSALDAQRRVTRDADVRSSPDGNVVAMVRSGTTWDTGTSRSGWTLVKLEGWVSSTRFAGARDTFPESIGGSSTLRLRSAPSLNGRILGEFQPLAGIRVVERRGTWARVQRDAWVQSTAMVRARPAAATTAAAAANTPATDSVAAVPAPVTAPGRLRSDRVIQLRAAPTGDTIGRLEPGAVLDPVARDRGMVKVRLEAWVAESLLTPADSTLGSDFSAADLRLRPEEFKGRTLRWDVQVIALQRGDGLRKDLATDEPYLLAMGPGSENAVLYVAVPPSLLEEAEGLSPLAKVLITARVRNGRSQPTGVPVLELVSIIRR